MDYKWQTWKNLPAFSSCVIRDVAPLKQVIVSTSPLDGFVMHDYDLWHNPWPYQGKLTIVQEVRVQETSSEILHNILQGKWN